MLYIHTIKRQFLFLDENEIMTVLIFIIYLLYFHTIKRKFLFFGNEKMTVHWKVIKNNFNDPSFSICLKKFKLRYQHLFCFRSFLVFVDIFKLVYILV